MPDELMDEVFEQNGFGYPKQRMTIFWPCPIIANTKQAMSVEISHIHFWSLKLNRNTMKRCLKQLLGEIFIFFD